MNKNVKIHRIADHSDEWHKYRSTGIGASEIATVLSLDENRFIGGLFDEKIGRKDAFIDPNKHMHWGTIMEELVANNWQYYDGDSESYIHNYAKGELQRKCHRINGIITNPKYPWLFTNWDRAMNIGSYRLDNKNHLTEQECPLECKTIHPMQMQRYEAGLPVAHLAQVHQQMLIAEVDYSEIAIFDCLRGFYVFPVKYSEKFGNDLIEASEMFWNHMVRPAGGLFDLQKKTTNQKEWEELEAEIARFEPPPDDSNACEQYLKERYRGNQTKMLGTTDHYTKAREYEFIKAIAKQLDGMKREISNELKSIMGDVEELDFEEAGRLDWKANSKGIRTFATRLKGWKPDEDIVKGEVDKIKLILE